MRSWLPGLVRADLIGRWPITQLACDQLIICTCIFASSNLHKYGIDYCKWCGFRQADWSWHTAMAASELGAIPVSARQKLKQWTKQLKGQSTSCSLNFT